MHEPRGDAAQKHSPATRFLVRPDDDERRAVRSGEHGVIGTSVKEP